MFIWVSPSGSSREDGSPILPLTPPDMRVRIRQFGERQGT